MRNLNSFILERLKLNKDTKSMSFYYSLYNLNTDKIEGYDKEIDAIDAVNKNWENYDESGRRVSITKYDNKNYFNKILDLFNKTDKYSDNQEKYQKLADEWAEIMTKHASTKSYSKKEIKELVTS